MPPLLRRLRKLVAPKPLEPAVIECGGKPLSVVFRHNERARRLVLRLNADGTAALVTVPHGASRLQAIAFVHRSSDWLSARLKQHGENIYLRHGSHIPLRGEDHEIRHLPLRRGTVAIDPLARTILVPGDPLHLSRRLTDWLKRAAKEELTAASQRYAALMGARYRRITIRDQKSRWGSCSAAGDLSYSWRLILAPAYVLDYVAAHEVAHLVHMNHGTRFWRLVLTHCPDAPRAKKWIKQHGHRVHRIVACQA
jgi:predicted metal-dependent hydrolase